jgi:5-hydroxyisourate hydrolase
MISTHVLDTSSGRPATGLVVALEVQVAGSHWQPVASASTNGDGRVPELASGAALAGKTCRLRFETGDYFRARGLAGFFPYVEVVFVVESELDRYHVPLLLSPFGYSTYRGS